MMKLVLMLTCLLALGVPAQAAIYKWVDANGVVTFKDTPPPEGVEAQRVELEPNFVDHSPAPEGDRGSARASAAATREGRGTPSAQGRVVMPGRLPRVELFTTSWCPYCIKAKQYLDALRIPYTEYDMEKNPRAEEIRRRYDSGSSIPLAIIGDAKIRGFNPATYDQALGIRRVN